MRDESKKPKRRGPSPTLLILGLSVVVLGGALAGWRAYGPYPSYSIPSGSMVPTLHPGDYIIAHGARGLCDPPELRAGQVVLSREKGVTFVRRLIAGPGQTVRLQEGRLWIDAVPVKTEAAGSSPEGRLLRETLANGASYLTQDMTDRGVLDDTAPVTVPAGHWFLLGDNRDNSLDSRVNGPVPTSAICAQAIKIIKSRDKDAIGRRLD
jgi:signal peptidase I